MTAPFSHRTSASQVIFRNGALEDLPAQLATCGIRRPMVLCGRRTAASSLFLRVDELLEGLPRVTFTAVPPHSFVDLVESLAVQAMEEQVDGFVAVGGGSVSDTAKAVALLLAEGGRLHEHANRFTPPNRLVAPDLRQPKLPIVSIPCTASAAEVTPSLGIRAGDGSKLLFSDPKLASRVIIIDPVANLCVPIGLMLSTGMNGLAHCIEGLYSKQRTPISDALALRGTALFLAALPAAAERPANSDRRGDLLVAAHLSGQVLVNARTCLHHAICHALGAGTGIAHGDANSVMLPHVVRFNAEAAAGELKEAARASGIAGGAEELEDCLRKLQARLGVPTRLRDLGVKQEMLSEVAAHVMHERGLLFNPRPVAHAGELSALLQSAW
jgi:alcohol dehydrogenase